MKEGLIAHGERSSVVFVCLTYVFKEYLCFTSDSADDVDGLIREV